MVAGHMVAGRAAARSAVGAPGAAAGHWVAAGQWVAADRKVAADRRAAARAVAGQGTGGQRTAAGHHALADCRACRHSPLPHGNVRACYDQSARC